MSRENIFRTIALVALVLFVTGGVSYIRSTIFLLRPVQLTIIDRETEGPIEGIPVYHVLRSYVHVNTLLFFLPRPDPMDKIKFEIMDKYTSDKFGKVTIKQRKVKLWQLIRPREIYDERIYINLCPRMEIKTEKEKIKNMINNTIYLNRDHFANPVKKYKGYFILSEVGRLPYEYRPRWGQSASVKVISEGLSKPKEELIIKLSTWK